MTEIKIGNRTVPMTMTTFELIAIQEEIGCTVAQLRDQVFGIEKDEETDKISMTVITDPEKMKKFGTLVRILGNAGLEEAGEAADLTEKKVLRGIRPDEIGIAVSVCMSSLAEGMKSEIPDDIEKKVQEGPVDVTLEKLKKKDGTES